MIYEILSIVNFWKKRIELVCQKYDNVDFLELCDHKFHDETWKEYYFNINTNFKNQNNDDFCKLIYKVNRGDLPTNVLYNWDNFENTLCFYDLEQKENIFIYIKHIIEIKKDLYMLKILYVHKGGVPYRAYYISKITFNTCRKQIIFEENHHHKSMEYYLSLPNGPDTYIDCDF